MNDEAILALPEDIDLVEDVTEFAQEAFEDDYGRVEVIMNPS